MAMILKQTQTGTVIDWEDRDAIKQFIDSCWEKHLAGELIIDGGDISQFTRRNLTRRMAQLFDSLV